LQKRVLAGEKSVSQLLADLQQALAELEKEKKEFKTALADKDTRVQHAEATAKMLEKDVQVGWAGAATMVVELRTCNTEFAVALREIENLAEMQAQLKRQMAAQGGIIMYMYTHTHIYIYMYVCIHVYI